MVYSTCSILKEENENIIFDFLNKNTDFEMVKNSKYSIMPDRQRDGFFICKLHKKKYYINITGILHFHDKSTKGIALLFKNGKIKMY